MNYSFDPAARKEYHSAVRYYEGARPSLGADFVLEVERTIAQILENPERWHKISTNYRRCNVRRFPYAVVYEVTRDGVLIFAVAHHSRRPNYWKRRLKK
jgi:plasmid stabilization system protein ParE